MSGTIGKDLAGHRGSDRLDQGRLPDYGQAAHGVGQGAADHPGGANPVAVSTRVFGSKWGNPERSQVI